VVQSPPLHVSEHAVWAGSQIVAHLPPGQSMLQAPALTLSSPCMVSTQFVLQFPPVQLSEQDAISRHVISQPPPSHVASQPPPVQ
jgi:hypothetical protein